MVVEVAVEAADFVFIHHEGLLCLVLRCVLKDEPIVVVGQPTVLIRDAHNLLVCLAPALSRPPYLNLDDFCGVLLNQWQLELLEKLAHDERTFVLHEVLLDALFLVLTSFVHQSQHRVYAKLHRATHIIFIAHFEEVELRVAACLEIDLAEVLVEELEEDEDTIGIDEQG